MLEEKIRPKKVDERHGDDDAHGLKPSDVEQDLEGLQTLRTLGHNMAYILACLEAGKKAGVALPIKEKHLSTNFIR